MPISQHPGLTTSLLVRFARDVSFNFHLGVFEVWNPSNQLRPDLSLHLLFRWLYFNGNMAAYEFGWKQFHVIWVTLLTVGD